MATDRRLLKDFIVAESGFADSSIYSVAPRFHGILKIREILVHATDHDPAAGLGFVQQVVALMRASGRFAPTGDTYAGDALVERLREALARVGFQLDADGAVRPLVVDNLSGIELTDALAAYVRRINLNPDDAPLTVGTGKELDEATARHVLNESVCGHPVGGQSGNFPVTLSQAFTVLGMKIPVVEGLDADPGRQVEECLFLLACAVNRLHNQAGTGHGRPAPSAVAHKEARLAARATALVAGALLERL